MTPETIRAAINADPELLALVPDTFALATALSAGRTRTDTAQLFKSLGIAEKFPAMGGLPGPLAAEMVLQKLEGFAAAAIAGSDPVGKLLGSTIKRQMVHLIGAGMAIGSPAIASMLGVIVQMSGGTLTQAEADALVSVAAVPDPVSEFDVRRAIFNDDGSMGV